MKSVFQLTGKQLESNIKLYNLHNGFKKVSFPNLIISMDIESMPEALPILNLDIALFNSFSVMSLSKNSLLAALLSI